MNSLSEQMASAKLEHMESDLAQLKAVKPAGAVPRMLPAPARGTLDDAEPAPETVLPEEKPNENLSPPEDPPPDLSVTTKIHVDAPDPPTPPSVFQNSLSCMSKLPPVLGLVLLGATAVVIRGIVLQMRPTYTSEVRSRGVLDQPSATVRKSVDSVLAYA